MYHCIVDPTLKGRSKEIPGGWQDSAESNCGWPVNKRAFANLESSDDKFMFRAV